MPTFPATLPDIQRSGYSLEPQNPVIRTEMEAGPARQRKAQTTVPVDITVKWIFTNAQYSTFKSFWASDVNNGTDWFDLAIQDAGGVATAEVRFKEGKFKADQLAFDQWQISATLEKRVY